MNSFGKINFLIFVFVFANIFVKGQAVTIDNLAVTATSGLTMTISGDLKNQNGGTIDNAGTITVSGNWTNNATNNVFSTSTGTVQFIGTAAQTITGSNSTSFYNLTLNNSYSSSLRYTLGTNQTVKNTLTLSAGNTNLAGYTLTLGTSAASPGTLTYTAGWLYGGTLKRWFATSTIANGAAAGLFPIGTSSDYRPFYVSAPSVAPTTGGTISVSHTGIIGTAPVSFTDINITIDRVFNSYWDVSTANGLAGGTYNTRIEGTGFTGIVDYTALRLTLGSSSVGTYGTNAGSNSNPQVNRTGLTLAQLTNRPYIGYPAAAGPLPIELFEFDAKPNQSEVIVNWTTSSEINTDYFTIERSDNCEMYGSIATTKGAGNSSSNRYYSITDNDPLQGTSFYRLKETDFDGYIWYSSPVTVHFNTRSNEFEIVSTHSASDQISVTILSPAEENFELYFYDCIGKLFQKQKEL